MRVVARLPFRSFLGVVFIRRYDDKNNIGKIYIGVRIFNYHVKSICYDESLAEL